jgi:hypothetical protein
LTSRTEVFSCPFQFYIQRHLAQVLGPTDAERYLTFPKDFFTGLLEQNTECTVQADEDWPGVINVMPGRAVLTRGWKPFIQRVGLKKGDTVTVTYCEGNILKIKWERRKAAGHSRTSREGHGHLSAPSSRHSDSVGKVWHLVPLYQHQIIALDAPVGALTKTRALSWFYFKFDFIMGKFVQLTGVVNNLTVSG